MHFADYTWVELRNDDGRPWVAASEKFMPFRATQFGDLTHVPLPSASQASQYRIIESSEASAAGTRLQCFSATQMLPQDVVPHRFKWCFDADSGLLLSEELPLDRRIIFSQYVSFAGKQVFTHVDESISGLPALEIDLQYSPLEPHALDHLEPLGSMQRKADIPQNATGEQVHDERPIRDVVPVLPPDTPAKDSQLPVFLRIYVGEHGDLLDASVEQTPDVAMAQTALEAIPQLQFAPFAINGQPAAVHFYYEVRLRQVANSARPAVSGPAASPMAENAPLQLEQLRSMFEAQGARAQAEAAVERQILAEQKNAPWFPSALLAEMLKAEADVDRAASALPYYRSCMSESEARVVTLIAETPGGHAYGQTLIGIAQASHASGQTVPQALNQMVQRDPGFDPHLLDQLDEQDRRHAHAFFGSHRSAEVSACVLSVQPQIQSAIYAAQLAVQKQFVLDHQQELAAAEQAYEAGHPGTTR